MPTDPTTSVIDHVRRAMLRQGGAGLGDGELLGEFIDRHDEAALAAFVRRHGPMVWGVCRRLLCHHDAEGAFQATFLVLVRKAASVVPRAMVANWLYGVAHQTALQARRATARRAGRERQVTEMPEPAVTEQDRWRDLQPLLDDELSRLPDRYRAVVVLCDLEGKTRKEAARQLRLPEGTVGGWLARARAMLAKRLAQRGVVLSGGALAAVLSGSASASVPPALVASTIKAASVLAAGKAAAGAISVEVAALTDGVMKAMLFTKLKSSIAVVLVLGVMGAGGTSLAYRMAAGQDGKKPVAEKSLEGNNRSSKDLSKIEPPGGVPLSLVEPGTNKIGVDQLNKARERLQSVPEKALEQWVVELERITDVKLKDGLPSPRQACRTDLVVRMSVAFDDLRWNATAADKLYKRACTMRTAEAKAWEEAFESVLKKEIGIGQTGKDEFSNLAGGPPWAVPLVLIPVDALHEGQKYSVGRGKKYLARLKQLTRDDVALWRDKIDMFGGTELDAAVNIILLDDFFSDEQFQRDKFKAAVERQDGKKPTAEKAVNPAATQEKGKDKEVVTAWGKEVGGLQAGLGIRPGERRAYHHGETVTLVVRVRNVGKEAVKFEYVKQFLDENPPTVADADGETVRQHGATVTGLIHVPVQVTLEPGKEIALESRIHGASGRRYELRPAGGGGRPTTEGWPLVVGTGQVGLQYERVFDDSSIGRIKLDPKLAKLATGKLELEIKEAAKK
jgi:RNA polymerase sigma factor (sigma-70 family)